MSRQKTVSRSGKKKCVLIVGRRTFDAEEVVVAGLCYRSGST